MRSDGLISVASRATTADLRGFSLLVIAAVVSACSLFPSDDTCVAILRGELAGARLVEDGGSAVVILRDGREVHPVWPNGYTARRTDSGIEIRHRDGTLMARTGDVVDLGGDVRGDRVEICTVEPHDPVTLGE